MPIHITTPTQLQNMNSDLTANYILDNDLDMTGVTWTPIGISGFTGTFNGQSHTISNLSLTTGSDYAGLFGKIISGASVINVKLSNFAMSGAAYVGALAGYVESSTITNVRVVEGSVFGTSNIGGAIGKVVTGAISKCSSTATAEGTTLVGGLIGFGSGTISNCYSTGEVQATDVYIGGLIGRMNAGTILNCYAAPVSVHGDADVGGLIGYWNPDGSSVLQNSYAVSAVSGSPGGGYIPPGVAGGLIGLITL